MQLNILDQQEPWFADGLKFTCTQCGNCCTGGPGFVWISQKEIVRLAEFLKLSREVVVERYCRKFDGRLSLKERRSREGNYDCIFLKETGPTDSQGGVSQRRRVCTIYPVRPLQCRTWPFWPENLSNPQAWDRASGRCPGMGRGDRHFPREKIESLRDAKDWPRRPAKFASLKLDPE